MDRYVTSVPSRVWHTQRGRRLIEASPNATTATVALLPIVSADELIALAAACLEAAAIMQPTSPALKVVEASRLAELQSLEQDIREGAAA